MKKVVLKARFYITLVIKMILELLLMVITIIYLWLTYINRRSLFKVIVYKLKVHLPDLVETIYLRIAKQTTVPTPPETPKVESVLDVVKERITVPSPKVLRYFEINIPNIIRFVQMIKKEEPLFSDLINWLVVNIGENLTLKALKITKAELHVYQTGRIDNPIMKQKILEYFAKNHPKVLLEIAKKHLPEPIHKLIWAYIKRVVPKEFKLCERLRGLKISSIAYIEMSREYGPILRAVITPSKFMNSLIDNPASVAELFIVAKYARAIDTEYGSKVFIRRAEIKGEEALILIDAHPMVNLVVLRQIIRDTVNIMNKLDLEKSDLLVEGLKKALAL